MLRPNRIGPSPIVDLETAFTWPAAWTNFNAVDRLLTQAPAPQVVQAAPYDDFGAWNLMADVGVSLADARKVAFAVPLSGGLLNGRPPLFSGHVHLYAGSTTSVLAASCFVGRTSSATLAVTRAAEENVLDAWHYLPSQVDHLPNGIRLSYNGSWTLNDFGVGYDATKPILFGVELASVANAGSGFELFEVGLAAWRYTEDYGTAEPQW